MALDPRPKDVALRKRALEVAKEALASPQLNASEMARSLGMDRRFLGYAILIRQHGSPEEIALAESGGVGLRDLGETILQRVPATERAAKRKPIAISQEHMDTRKFESEVWQKLRDGIVAINNLPAPKDTAAIVRKNPARVEMVNRHLLAAITWIKEFEDEITK